MRRNSMTPLEIEAAVVPLIYIVISLNVENSRSIIGLDNMYEF